MRLLNRNCGIVGETKQATELRLWEIDFSKLLIDAVRKVNKRASGVVRNDEIGKMMDVFQRNL